MPAVVLAARDITAENPSPTMLESLMRINEYGPFGYIPNLGGAIVFAIVFGICAAWIFYKGISRRAWWVLGTLGIGAAFECAGNALRIAGHYDSQVTNVYIAQQVILVLTPAFIAACHFTSLGKLGMQYPQHLPAWLQTRPQWITIFFVVVDVASLGIQGAGSGLAGSNEASDTDADLNTINNYGKIVVGGLVLQLVGYLVFNVVLVLFGLRLRRAGVLDQQQATGLRRFLIAVFAASAFIFVRSVFRTVEMAIGWIGPVATVEWYYLVFDATLVAASVIILTVISPAVYAQAPSSTTTKRGSLQEKRSIDSSEEV